MTAHPGWEGRRGRRVRGGGAEHKGERTHGHGQQCGDCWGRGGSKGANGNGKNTIKIKKINKDSFKKSLFSFPFLFFTF